MSDTPDSPVFEIFIVEKEQMLSNGHFRVYLPQAEWFEFGTFVIPSQTTEQLVSSPTSGLTLFPVHMVQMSPFR